MQSTTPQAEFIMLQSSLSAKLTKRVESQLSFHGISFTEYLILRFLNEAPQKTMRRIDLAECVGISASGVTRLLAPMEKRKLVEKEANARDARVSLVKLTKPGQRVYTEAAESFEHSADFLTERLSGNQLSTLIELTNRLI
jgi:DNA-binding MarR family transcriptional regulator